MAMIFDNFPSLEQAEAFADSTMSTFHIFDIQVCEERDDQIDPFPYALDGPVVYVPRTTTPDGEYLVQGMVQTYGGRFAGT